jgi:hypothetical protein
MDGFFGFDEGGELRSTTHCGGGGGGVDMVGSIVQKCVLENCSSADLVFLARRCRCRGVESCQAHFGVALATARTRPLPRLPKPWLHVSKCPIYLRRARISSPLLLEDALPLPRHAHLDSVGLRRVCIPPAKPLRRDQRDKTASVLRLGACILGQHSQQATRDS